MINDLVNVGFGNVLAVNRVVAITTPTSSPTKRAITSAKANNLLIDMTNGRRNKAVIYLDSGHVVLAALSPETLTGRFQSGKSLILTKTDMEEDNND